MIFKTCKRKLVGENKIKLTVEVPSEFLNLVLILGKEVFSVH